MAPKLVPSGVASAVDAAALLGVPEQTVYLWIETGVLEATAHPGSVVVTETSLAETLGAVRTIRELEGDDSQVRDVLDALEDRRTREQVQGSVADLEAGSYVDIGPADLDSLFHYT